MLRGKTQEADLVSISTDICTYKVSEQTYAAIKTGEFEFYVKFC